MKITFIGHKRVPSREGTAGHAPGAYSRDLCMERIETIIEQTHKKDKSIK